MTLPIIDPGPHRIDPGRVADYYARLIRRARASFGYTAWCDGDDREVAADIVAADDGDKWFRS